MVTLKKKKQNQNLSDTESNTPFKLQEIKQPKFST